MEQSDEINESRSDSIDVDTEMVPPDKPCSMMDAVQKHFSIGAIKNQQVVDMPGEQLFQIPSDEGDDEDDDTDMDHAWDRLDLEIGEEDENCPELSQIAIHDEVSSMMRKKINMSLTQAEILEDLEEFRKRISFPPLPILKDKSFKYLHNPGAIPEEYEVREAEVESEMDMETNVEGETDEREGSPDAIVPDEDILPVSIPLAKLPRASPPNGLRIHNNNVGEGSPPPVETEPDPEGNANSRSTMSAPLDPLPDKVVEPEDVVQKQIETEAIPQNQRVLRSKRKQISNTVEGSGPSKVTVVAATAGKITNGGVESDSQTDITPMAHDGDNAKEQPTPIQVKISSSPVKTPFKIPEVPTASQSPKPNIYVPTPPTIVLPMRRISADLNESSSLPMNSDPLSADLNESSTLPMNSDPLSAGTEDESFISEEPSSISNGKLDLNSVLECQFCREHFSPYEDNLFRKHLLLQHDFEIEKDKYFDKKRIPALTSNQRKPLKHGCGICGDVFSARYELKRHIEGSHDNFISKIILYPGFRCAQCLKGFNSSFELTNHCLVCSDKYPYPDTIRELAKNFLNCDLCGVTHQNTHEASKCYFSKSILRCALCFDIFKMKDNFYKHLHSYHGLQFHAYPKFTLPCPFCRGCYACWGKYQEIFPHIVADHYQQSLDAIVPSSSRGGGGGGSSNSTTNGNSGASNNAISIYRQQHQHVEPGMPIVMSVVGNYAPTR